MSAWQIVAVDGAVLYVGSQMLCLSFHLIDRAHESMRQAERLRGGVQPVKGKVICD